jgi:hypothetical protein
MSKKGFEYTEQPGKGRARPFWEANFGLNDPERARKYGYHIPEQSKRPDTSSISTAAYKAALGKTVATSSLRDPISGTQLGTLDHKDGCEGEASTALYVDAARMDRYIGLKMTLQQEAYDTIESVRTSTAFSALTVEWVGCMRQKGFQYKDPFEPFATAWPETAPQADEIRVALADVECKQSVQYLDRVQTLLLARVEVTGDQLSTLLTEFGREQAELEDRATVILNS